ncbi:MAG: hemerythrin domain-containing protein [Lysobacteraceae bacterium]|nr:MAG: hemerythrin domain-containing protein [Xanthomonadaceae bacterium]
MPRDILVTLKSEHDMLRSLFDQINATTDRARKKRGDLLRQIELSLVPHAKWEEFHFYPAFKARADRDGLKTHAEALVEHQAVELTVLPEVKASDIDTPRFAGAVKVLGELVDHHASEEETTMFKMARKLFSAKERAELDVQYEEWKDSAASKGVLFHAEVKTGLKAAIKKMIP